VTVTEHLQAAGWSDTLIFWSKVSAAIGTLCIGFLAVVTITNIAINIPTKLANVEARVNEHSQVLGQFEQWIKFTVQRECAKTPPDIKQAMRESGGVDCDAPELRVRR
jgi:hypothetical protein